MANYDIDEILVPQMHYGLTDLFEYLEKYYPRLRTLMVEQVIFPNVPIKNELTYAP